jgi:hypothetical protein
MMGNDCYRCATVPSFYGQKQENEGNARLTRDVLCVDSPVMLTGNHKNLRDANAAGARLVMVASLAHARVIAFKMLFATVAWPAPGQRERE